MAGRDVQDPLLGGLPELNGIALRIGELGESAVGIHLCVDGHIDPVSAKLPHDRVEVPDAEVEPQPEGPSGAPSKVLGNGARTVAPASCVHTVPS